MPPLISCIVPVFNGERYLRESLDSILAQTYAPLEVIVVDDGSTDATPMVARSYGDRIRYLYQRNAGHAAARNRGLGTARGALVAFLDADDLWHPEKLERQMARFRAVAALDACVTAVQNFWSPEVAADHWFAASPVTEAVPGYRSVTLLARRTLFETVGRFDPELRHGNDTDWFLRAVEQGAAIELVQEVLVFRRLHAANRSRLLADSSRSEYVRILKASLDRKRAAARMETDGGS
jgi:glycosyltransferase involved in cell wall biosynthesis